MSHAQSTLTGSHDHDHEYDREHDHDDRHPALTPLVIDLLPDQTQAELEAVIDESLAVEPETREGAGPFIDPKADDTEEVRT